MRRGFTSLAILASLSLGLVAILMVKQCAGISFDEREGEGPLSEIRVTRHWGKPSEVFARLDASTRLSEVAALQLLSGFSSGITAEEAASQFGPATGTWRDPYYRVDAPFYDRGRMRISICRVSGSYDSISWVSIAHPRVPLRLSELVSPAVVGQVQEIFAETSGAVRVHLWREGESLSFSENDGLCSYLSYQTETVGDG